MSVPFALVRTPEAEEIVGDRAVGGQPFEERHARLRVDEAIAVEGAHLGLGRLARIAEYELQVRVGRDGGGRTGTKRPDVHAFVYGFEQTRERPAALIHSGIIRGS